MSTANPPRARIFVVEDEAIVAADLEDRLKRMGFEVTGTAATGEEALRKILRVATGSLVPSNRAFHQMLRDGVDVEYSRPDGSIKGDKARLIDFFHVDTNDWFVVNQFTASGLIKMYDGVATTASSIGNIKLNATVTSEPPYVGPYEGAFANGLTIKLDRAMDVTVCYL